jgi:hypothetical protein
MLDEIDNELKHQKEEEEKTINSLKQIIDAMKVVSLDDETKECNLQLKDAYVNTNLYN